MLLYFTCRLVAYALLAAGGLLTLFGPHGLGIAMVVCAGGLMLISWHLEDRITRW